MQKPTRVPLDPAPELVLVAFGGHSDLPWLRLLRRGFRHCFLLRRVAAGWLVYDPRSDATELALWSPCGAGEIANYLHGKGYVLCLAPRIAPERRAAPLAPFTCVEAVKRVLGIRKRWILTPWQLFRYLQKHPG